MKKLFLLLFIGILLIGSVSAWTATSELSDSFSDGVMNTTLWYNTTNVYEIGGYVNISSIPSAGTLQYISTVYNFNKSVNWKIEFNFSHASGEQSFIAICNKTSGISAADLGNGFVCPSWNVATGWGLYYANNQNKPRTPMYIIVNGTNRSASLYHWDNTLNTTINLVNLTNYSLVFGTYGAAARNMSLFDVNVYQTTTPLITTILSSPSNNSRVFSVNVSLIANYSLSSMNVSNGTYYIWYFNKTLYNTTFTVVSKTTNQSNITFFNIPLGETFLWNVYGCGNTSVSTECSWGNNGNYTFISSIFSETNVMYNNSVHDTSRQRFSLNVSGNPAITSASSSFWYNGTMYSATTHNGISGVYSSVLLIDIPLQENINGSGNRTFLWEWTFTLTNGNVVKQNSTTYSHQVNRTYIVFCNSTYNVPFVNFTSKQAVNPFPRLNATFKSAWNFWLGNGDVKRNYTFEDVTETNSTWSFCGSPLYETIKTDTNIEYDANGYAQNYYYLTNASLTNNSNLISLYLLNDTLATVTELITWDNAQNPVSNVYIQIQLYDVGTDTFYTVGMAKTSQDGKDIVYLNWYSTLYKFILIQNGVVVKTTDPYKISSTPQTFTISDAVTYSFDKFRDFVYSLYYNNATQNFVLTFTKPSGLVDQGCLRVTKRTAYNDTEICLVCETSSSATLYCNIGSSGNGTFIATFYATGSWWLLDWVEETIGGTFAESIYDLLGNDDATAYAFLFSGIVVSMFFLSPVLAIVGLILGILGGAALGFTILNYSTFIGIVIIGGIIIWFVKR